MSKKHIAALRYIFFTYAGFTPDVGKPTEEVVSELYDMSYVLYRSATKNDIGPGVVMNGGSVYITSIGKDALVLSLLG